ncbi:MAG: hypothetical protein SPL08_05150 [Pseudomonadota bacterium]|nr:hypothetical protein [Pseudomonadota bacterium]
MEQKAQSIHEAIALLNQGRTLPSFGETVPPPPAIQDIIHDSHETNAGISLLVSIKYKSLSDHLKERDILIRRVIKNKNDLYLDGIAMDIRAPRLIKVSCIIEVHDITSGRVYQNPLDFIENRLGIAVSGNHSQKQTNNDFPQVISRTAHEMTVLMYLVAIDGHREKSERETVFRYIKSRTQDLVYPDSELNDYLIALAPDTESFTIALQEVLKKEKSVVQHFVETILDIIMVDGHIDPRERNFLIRLMSVLEQEGYEITLPSF